MSDLKHIKTWGERAAEKFQADQILYEEAKQQTVIDCMRAEISELRQELARRTQPEATAPAQDLSAAIRKGWEGAAKALAERAAGHFRAKSYSLQDECLQCASMLHDLKPAASSANALSAGDRVDALAVEMAKGYESGTFMSAMDDGGSVIRLHYQSSDEAQSAFDAISTAIDAAIIQSQKAK